LALQVRIEDAIADYNSRDRPLGISDLELLHIRQSFFTPALTRGRANWRSLATTFISYFLEWDYRARLLDLRVGDGTAEPFFLHLFKGCVLFESLLKANPKNVPTGSTLGQVLNYLSRELGIPSGLQIGNTTFPFIVRDLSISDDKIETAVRFAGRIRNTIGHDLGWGANFDRPQYDMLASMVACSCLHAIACLYR
jgi:hypothetical protein